MKQGTKESKALKQGLEAKNQGKQDLQFKKQCNLVNCRFLFIRSVFQTKGANTNWRENCIQVVHLRYPSDRGRSKDHLKSRQRSVVRRIIGNRVNFEVITRSIIIYQTAQFTSFHFCSYSALLKKNKSAKAFALPYKVGIKIVEENDSLMNDSSKGNIRKTSFYQ